MIAHKTLSGDGISERKVAVIRPLVTLHYLLRVVMRKTRRDLTDGVVHTGERRAVGVMGKIDSCAVGWLRPVRESLPRTKAAISTGLIIRAERLTMRP